MTPYPRQMSLFTLSGSPAASLRPSPPLPLPEPQPQPPVRNRVVEEAPRIVSERDELFSRAESLAWRLSADLGIPVRLAVTDNRSTMVSSRRRGHRAQRVQRPDHEPRRRRSPG